jgi:hypothetical protein
MKIVKSLSELSNFDLDSGGTTATCTWEQLKPYIGHCIHLRPGERIIGIIITQEGIKVRTDYKKVLEKI